MALAAIVVGFGTVVAPALHTARPAVVSAATLPALSVDDLRVSEGNSGTHAYQLTLRLNRPAPDTNFVTVKVATADGTAGAPGDYLPSIVQTTFPPGTTTRTILVNIVGDSQREPDEAFFVRVVSIQNATIAKGTGTVTIVNDD
jgi:hypothetical protein